MPSRAFRGAVTTLLVSTTLTLACAAPSHAAQTRHRAFEGSTSRVHTRSFVASLVWRFLDLRFLDLAGGAMDPNGCH
jgi:hypothetical protein